jgi:hypothetical protein
MELKHVSLAYAACAILILVYAWNRFNTPTFQPLFHPHGTLLVELSGLHAEHAGAVLKTQTLLPSADLVIAGIRSDQHAQSRWLANACHQTHWSAD